MSKDVTQMNLPNKSIREKRVYCKLQQFYRFHLSKLIGFHFCLCRMLSIFWCGIILYAGYLVQGKKYSPKPVPYHVFLLIFNNTIIMRYYICLCDLQGYPFCFWSYNYSDSVVNLLNVIDSNPEQSSSNLRSTTLKVIRTTQIKLAAKWFIIDDHGSVSHMFVIFCLRQRAVL